MESSTISGYAILDAMDTLERSIEDGDAESACCMASELACTPLQVQPLIAMLVQIYAQWYVSVDMMTLGRIAKDVAAMSSLPHDPAARRALCDMVVAMSLALPRQNAFEILSGRVSSASRPLTQTQPMPLVAMTSRLAGLMEHNSTEAVRLAQQILTEMAARKTPAAAVTAAVCAMWDACIHVASDVPPCREFVASAHQLFQVGCKKDLPPNKRTCIARRNLLLCAILVAAGSATIRDGGSLPRSTWMAVRADATLKSALAKIDSVFNDILNPHHPHPHSHSQPQPTTLALSAPQHPHQHQHQHHDRDRDYSFGNNDLDSDSDSVPSKTMSYLRMYTTVDYQAAARTMDSIHKTRTDLSDQGYAPKTIIVRGGSGSGSGSGAAGKSLSSSSSSSRPTRG